MHAFRLKSVVTSISWFFEFRRTAQSSPIPAVTAAEPPRTRRQFQLPDSFNSGKAKP
jgi:hypothetical protein